MESLAAEMAAQAGFISYMAASGLVLALVSVLVVTVAAAIPRLRFLAAILVLVIVIMVVQPDAWTRFARAGMHFGQVAEELLGKPEEGVYY